MSSGGSFILIVNSGGGVSRYVNKEEFQSKSIQRVTPINISQNRLIYNNLITKCLGVRNMTIDSIDR